MTRNQLAIFSAIAIVAGSIAQFSVFDRDRETAAISGAPATAAAGTPAPLAPAQAPALAQGAESASPFGRGAAVTTLLADPALQREQRRKKMETQGYATPPHYYQMSVKALADLADKGDVYAMLQLGEQYYSENDALERDPDYRTDRHARQIGKEYLENASVAGHTQAAVIVSRKYMEEGKPVDAYIWTQLAEKLGNRQAVDLGQQALRVLTPQQKEMAEIKLNELYYRATQRFTQK